MKIQKTISLSTRNTSQTHKQMLVVLAYARVFRITRGAKLEALLQWTTDCSRRENAAATSEINCCGKSIVEMCCSTETKNNDTIRLLGSNSDN